jgi:tRNA(adenine34) deaminase
VPHTRPDYETPPCSIILGHMKYQTDIEKMKVALEQAQLAYELNEVPVGAALFDISGELICADHNRRELNQDPTAHAEILVLKRGSEEFKSWRLEGTSLAVTLEPDPMCAGAIVNARVGRLIYGAPNEKAGAAWTLYNIPQDPRLNHYVEMIDGILLEETEELLTSFFENRR